MRLALIDSGVVIDVVSVHDDWLGAEGEWQPSSNVTTDDVSHKACGPGWSRNTDGSYTPPHAPAVDLSVLRAVKGEEIKSYALTLMQSRIPALDSFAMVGFLKTIWPTLTSPESQPDLAYCRDVYVYALGKLDQLSTATRAQIEGYNPAQDTGWPS